MLLTIEKLIYGGDGLARLPSDAAHQQGKAVFLPFVLQGEEVEAAAVKERPGFVRARADRIAQPSPSRVAPRCPYFQRCGGCHYQHTGYEHQLEIKRAILQENLRRLARLDWQEPIALHPSPPWQYRNRTRLQLRCAPEFSLAYYQLGTHELLPVEECPLSSPLINRALAAVWDAGRSGVFPAAAHEIEFFADHADERLLIELYLQEASGDVSPEQLHRELAARLGAVATVALFAADLPGREPRRLGLAGDAVLEYAVAGERYRVSPGSFFQTNRHLAEELLRLVTRDRSGALALDLYAGVGLFSLPLARSFQRVMAVESAPIAARDLAQNAPPNVKVVRATTQQYLEQHAAAKRRPDLVIADPPRVGLGAAVVRGLAQLAPPRLIYVSCDPATLSRDLRMLLESGFHVETVHLVDLFPQTFHLESVVELGR